jgi:patatin-like phospholipase/acyl hydrolase
LAELESRYLGGAPVARYFDIMAGTSMGGIIALALAHGKTAQRSATSMWSAAG